MKIGKFKEIIRERSRMQQNVVMNGYLESKNAGTKK